jgi:hypothetical protein
MNLDNPASRLLLILEEGKRKAAHENCLTAWQEILNTEGNLSLTLARLGKNMNMPEQVVQTLLDLYPSHTDVWSHWHSRVTTAFEQQNLKGNWQSFIQHIDENSLTMLKMTETLIEAKLKSTTLDLEKIDETRKTLDELLNEIINSNISNDLKAFIARKIREIIITIDEYKLTGLMPILDAVDSAIGHAVTNTEYNEFLKKESLGKKLRDTLADVANLVTTAGGIAAIASEIAKRISN